MNTARIWRPLALVALLLLLSAREAGAQSNLAQLADSVRTLSSNVQGGALLGTLRADIGLAPQLMEATVRLHEGTLDPNTLGALEGAGLAGLIRQDLITSLPRRPGFAPTWTGTLTQQGNQLFLTTPSGARVRLLEPNGMAVTQWAEESAAFVGGPASVRGYPGAMGLVIFANAYTPGVTDDFVHGRVYRVAGGDIVVRDANGIEVVITDPQLRQRLGLFASTGYMGTGVILNGPISAQAGRLVYSGNPSSMWMLTAPNRQPNGGSGGTAAFAIGDGYFALDSEVPVENSSMASVTRSPDLFAGNLSGRAFQRGRILQVGADAPSLGLWAQTRIFDTDEIRPIPSGIDVWRGSNTPVNIASGTGNNAARLDGTTGGGAPDGELEGFSRQ